MLLEIFCLYLDSDRFDDDQEWLPAQVADDEWHTLVHVCCKWRRLMFACPRRLKLRLLCTDARPVRNKLNVWPELPIVISAIITKPRRQGTNNIIYTLKRHDRVHKIHIRHPPNSLLKKMAEMNMPFPALAHLELTSEDEDPAVLPKSFLGGSAPRLRRIWLRGISFPQLGKLLSSTRDLVTLSLSAIPRSGYISPDAIVTCISTLTRLKYLTLQFRFPRSRTERANRYRPPPARVDLPSLTRFRFTGNSEYLEDTVSRIKTPRLFYLEISVFNQLVFNTPQLGRFIGLTEEFGALHEATALFSRDEVQVRVSDRKGMEMLVVKISCQPLEWQLPSLTQVYTSSLSPLLTLEHLCIGEPPHQSPQLQDDIPENAQWLEFLHQFTFVKDLQLSKHLVPLIGPALGELTRERATQVLPALQNIYMEPEDPLMGLVEKPIDQFIASRRHSGCPITVHQQEMYWTR